MRATDWRQMRNFIMAAIGFQLMIHGLVEGGRELEWREQEIWRDGSRWLSRRLVVLEDALEAAGVEMPAWEPMVPPGE